MIGLRVSAIIPGSRWDALGFRNEDLITEIAGTRIDSPESSVELFRLFAPDSDIELTRDPANQVRLVASQKRE